MRDYVGRQDVLVLLNKIERRTPDSKEWMCQEARFEILNMPPAEVRENVHGQWVKDETTYDGFTFHHCSVCGYPMYVGNTGKGINFCFNCGADMRGKE